LEVGRLRTCADDWVTTYFLVERQNPDLEAAMAFRVQLVLEETTGLWI